MNKRTFVWFCGVLPLLAVAADRPLSVSTGGDAATKQEAPAVLKGGAYCPDRASTYLLLEELTVGLEGVSRARENLLVLDDGPSAQIALARALSALTLAAGRGSGARMGTLIDAALSATQDGHPKANLAWFPLLKNALDGLPDDATRASVRAQIARAEAVLEGRDDGDEIRLLLDARSQLQCDPIAIPLQQAIADVQRLQRDLLLGKKPGAGEFSGARNSLEQALQAGLRRLAEVQLEKGL